VNFGVEMYFYFTWLDRMIWNLMYGGEKSITIVLELGLGSAFNSLQIMLLTLLPSITSKMEID